MEFFERDMYIPVASFFEEQGYEVKGEVKGCDLLACKEEKTIVVELKKAFNLKLLYQAVDRQEFSDAVYVGIAVSKKSKAEQRDMVKLLKRLDIGLLTVNMESPLKTVSEIVSPSKLKPIKSKRKRKQLDIEFLGRQTKENVGGVNKTKILTLYREKSIELLCLLNKKEKVETKELKKLGYDRKMYDILYRNYYGWFVKLEKATYGLSSEGIIALEKNEFPNAVNYYKEKIEKSLAE